MKSPLLQLTLLFGLLSCAGGHEAPPSAVEAEAEATTLRWRVAHAPGDYFIQMAQRFEEIVERDTEGRVLVDVLDETGCFVDRNPEMANQHVEEMQAERREIAERLTALNDGINYDAETLVGLRRAEGLQLLQQGEVEIAQNYSYYLAQVANPEYHALDLPYLFDDYGHVTAGLEGEAGERLLASTAGEGYRGLAYTFSGGLQVMLSRDDAPFTSAESWEGQRFREVSSASRQSALEVLGGESSPRLRDDTTHHRATDLIRRGLVDAEEINLPDVEHWLANVVSDREAEQVRRRRRLNVSGLAVTETQHALLSTVLLIREETFQSLSAADQAVVKAAALEAGRFERALTIQRYEDSKERLRAAGFPWHEVSDEFKSEVRAAARPVYESLYDEVPETREVVRQLRGLVGDESGAGVAEVSAE